MIRKLLAAVFVWALLLIVGAMDYQDEVDQAAHCASMVEQGAWPQAVCDG